MRIELPRRLQMRSIHAMLRSLSTEMVLEAGEYRFWCARSAGRSIQLDFTNTTFADIKALGALAIVARTLTGANGEIAIEAPKNESVARFVASSGFVAALADGPDYPVSVRAAPRFFAETLHHRLFPLQWITEGQDSKVFLRTVLRTSSDFKRTVPLPPSAAVNLADIVLEELVQNAIRHSGRTAALVAAWNQNSPWTPNSGDYQENEQPYVEAHKNQPLTAIHLFVADQGIGIAASMARKYAFEPGRLLNLAFDRWSTTASERQESRRGTRGLYRVERLANTRLGLISVASGPQRVARGIARSPDDSHQLYGADDEPFPGTMLAIEIPTSVEPTQRLPRGRPAGSELIVRQLTNGSADWDSLRSLYSSLEQADSRESIVVLEADQLDIDRHQAIELVRNLAEVSHPFATAVTGLPFNSEQLLTISDDVNQEIERDREDAALGIQETDPVLIIGSRLQRSYWAGVSAEIATMLERTDGDSASVSALAGTSVARHIPGSGWQLRLSVSSLRASLINYISSRIYQNVSYPRNAQYLTRAMVRVDGYCDVLDYLQRQREDRSLLTLLLASKIAEKSPSTLGREVAVLYEGSIESEFINALVQRLEDSPEVALTQIERIRTADLLTGRYLPLKHRTDVVVVVSGVGSGHTARQLIAMATRQGCIVQVVGAVLDTRRSHESPIRIWELEIPVAEAVIIPLQAGGASRPLKYLDSKGHVEKRTNKLPYDVSSEMLIEGLHSNPGALKLGHFSGSTDRHFTLFLDSKPLLQPGSPLGARILHSFLGRAYQWNRSTGASDDVIVTHSPENRYDRPAATLARAVKEALTKDADYGSRKFAMQARVSKGQVKSAHIIEVHWGSVSGHALVDRMNWYVSAGAKNVLFLIAFSQLDSEIEVHFRSLRRLTTFGTDTDIAVHFAAQLPISGFSQADCPVCWQSRGRAGSIHESVSPTEANREIRRLSVRSWNAEVLPGYSDVFSEQYGGSSAPFVLKAFEIRGRLVEAKRSTRDADRVAGWLRVRFQDEEFVIALSTLLSFEPQWLQSYPLADVDVRAAFAEVLRTLLLPKQQEWRSPDSFVRITLGLRLASKVVFCKSLTKLLESASFDDQAFAFCCHLVDRLLMTPYLVLTGLASVVEAQLLTVNQTTIKGRSEGAVRMLQILIARASGLHHDATTLTRQSRMEAWSTLRAKALEVCGHTFGHLLDAARLPSSEGEALLGVADAWSQIAAWMRRHLIGPVGELKDLLVNTQPLLNRIEFSRLFDVVDGATQVERIERLLIQAASIGRRLTEEEVSAVEMVHESIVRVLRNRKDAVGRASRLSRALGECWFTYRQVQDSLMDLGEAEGVQVAALDNRSELDSAVLMLPSVLLDTLLRIVIGNAKEYTTLGPPQVVCRLIGTPSGRLSLSLISLNSESVERDPLKPGYGGLIELEDIVVRGVKIKGGASAASNLRGYEVRVELEGGSWLS